MGGVILLDLQRLGKRLLEVELGDLNCALVSLDDRLALGDLPRVLCRRGLVELLVIVKLGDLGLVLGADVRERLVSLVGRGLDG